MTDDTLRAALLDATKRANWFCDDDEHRSAVHDKRECYCEKVAGVLAPLVSRALAASATDEPDDFGTVWHETRATVTSDGETTHYVAARPAVPALDVERWQKTRDSLDVIDGIVDDTHPEGDGCPLCHELDNLREVVYAALHSEEPTDDR